MFEPRKLGVHKCGDLISGRHFLANVLINRAQRRLGKVVRLFSFYLLRLAVGPDGLGEICFDEGKFHGVRPMFVDWRRRGWIPSAKINNYRPDPIGVAAGEGGQIVMALMAIARMVGGGEHG